MSLTIEVQAFFPIEFQEMPLDVRCNVYAIGFPNTPLILPDPIVTELVRVEFSAYNLVISELPDNYQPGRIDVYIDGHPEQDPITIDSVGVSEALRIPQTIFIPVGSYATVSDVQALIPKQILNISSLSTPSIYQVDTWLRQESSWVDSTLRWKCETPITDLDDRAMLTPIVAALVISKVWGVVAAYSPDVVRNINSARAFALSQLGYDAKTNRSMISLPGCAAGHRVGGPKAGAMPATMDVPIYNDIQFLTRIPQLNEP